jgi:hypothetical protein
MGLPPVTAIRALVEAGDQDAGTLTRERDGHGLADTAVAAGDHRGSARQPPRLTVALLA